MRRKTPKNLPSPALRFLTVLLALSAAVLSALQQLSLIKLAVVVPGAFSPLWLAPTLPAQLFLSSICACLAVIVFASWHTSLAFGKGLSPALISGIAKAMSILLPLYVCLRFLDLFDAGAFPLLFQGRRPLIQLPAWNRAETSFCSPCFFSSRIATVGLSACSTRALRWFPRDS